MPEKPITMYSYEASPFCKLVRPVSCECFPYTPAASAPSVSCVCLLVDLSRTLLCSLRLSGLV